MVVSNSINLVNHDFSTLLRQRRRELDLTRTELARRVGCSPDTIKKLEEGERRPSKELAELLADHLQIEDAVRATFIMLARTRGATIGEAGPTNLPAPLTSFVGRASEVEHIESLVRKGEVRLLTLMGPPGVGKSRLALYVAERLRTAFSDGVWFVPLAAVEDPQQVLLLIAKALSISDGGQGEPIDWLIAAMRNRRALLLLDNFEQLLDAAPYISQLLTACPQLSAIVTSRLALELYGEHQFVVHPLPVPPPPTWNMPAQLQKYEAIQLFVARIRAHTPNFHLSTDSAASVAELCFRLDGIPLAIELAAGLTRAESPSLLLADVEREGRLALLTTTQRDRIARQQTLREAIAWSVRRLSPSDQLLFARLGVFHGAFDQAAAYAVAGVTDDETTKLSEELFQQRLHALAAGHLVQLQGSKEAPRYRLLETLREYALERLQATGGTLAAQRRHAQYYAAIAFAIDPAKSAGTYHEWRDHLRPDYPDLVAALQLSLSMSQREPGDLEYVELTLEIASGLGHFWYIEGSWQEGLRWLQQAVELPGGRLALRSRANTELGVLYSALGRYPEAERHLNQAREEAAQAGDLLGVAWILAQLGYSALIQGQISVTRAYTHERLQIYRQIGNPRYLALTLEQIGCAAIEEGDYERGVPWVEECQALWESQDARAGVAAARLIIGMAELAQGNASSALTRFQKAYDDFDSIEHQHGLAWSLRNLGLAYLSLGQIPQAQFSLLRAFERYLELTGNETSTGVVMEAIAGIASRLGQHHLAAHLMGAATIYRQQINLPLTENSRQIYDRLLAASIKALGKTEWEQTVAHGATLPYAEAAVSARALLFVNVPQNKTAAPSHKRE